MVLSFKQLWEMVSKTFDCVGCKQRLLSWIKLLAPMTWILNDTFSLEKNCRPRSAFLWISIAICVIGMYILTLSNHYIIMIILYKHQLNSIENDVLGVSITWSANVANPMNFSSNSCVMPIVLRYSWAMILYGTLIAGDIASWVVL